jgi:hypothetical protein
VNGQAAKLQKMGGRGYMDCRKWFTTAVFLALAILFIWKLKAKVVTTESDAMDAPQQQQQVPDDRYDAKNLML